MQGALHLRGHEFDLHPTTQESRHPRGLLSGVREDLRMFDFQYGYVSPRREKVLRVPQVLLKRSHHAFG